MKSKKDKISALDSIKKIRDSLNEKKSAQRDAIHYELIHLENLLKKHVLDMQKKLDEYSKQFDLITDDKIAKNLLERITMELNDIGDDYAELLKFENNEKTPTKDLENLKVIHTICSRLFKIISNLQKINDVLDIEINDL
jgi:dGTP triphosphohydrolase